MKRIFITEFVSKAGVASALVLCLIIPAIVLAQETGPPQQQQQNQGNPWADTTQNQDGQQQQQQGQENQQQQQGQENPWGDFNPTPPVTPQTQNQGPPIDPTTGEPAWTGVDSNTAYPDGSKFVVHYYRDEYGRLNREMASIDKNGNYQKKSECKLPSGKVQNTTKPASGPQSNLNLNILNPPTVQPQSAPSSPSGGGGRAAPAGGSFSGGRGK
jgi:hypothetical protein